MSVMAQHQGEGGIERMRSDSGMAFALWFEEVTMIFP
jgi:hypothetical protein